ncbi:F0F1 ATP synthase subunit gamma [Sesbania bispinosa]|nr:F0F1 ATP synthase subunit gamma [Sesbania bispinosa]
MNQIFLGWCYVLGEESSESARELAAGVSYRVTGITGRAKTSEEDVRHRTEEHSGRAGGTTTNRALEMVAAARRLRARTEKQSTRPLARRRWRHCRSVGAAQKGGPDGRERTRVYAGRAGGATPQKEGEKDERSTLCAFVVVFGSLHLREPYKLRFP